MRQILENRTDDFLPLSMSSYTQRILDDVSFRRLVRGQLIDPDVEYVSKVEHANHENPAEYVQYLKYWSEEQIKERNEGRQGARNAREPSNVRNHYQILFHSKLAVNESCIAFWIASLVQIDKEYDNTFDLSQYDLDALKLSVFWVTFSRHFVYHRNKEIQRMATNHSRIKNIVGGMISRWGQVIQKNMQNNIAEKIDVPPTEIHNLIKQLQTIQTVL